MAIKITAKSIGRLLLLTTSVALLINNIIPSVASSDSQASPSVKIEITPTASPTNSTPSPNHLSSSSQTRAPNSETKAEAAATTTTTTTSGAKLTLGENSTTETTPTTPAISIEEAKQIISRHIYQDSATNRLTMNKPKAAPQMVDFAPDSIEAQVSEATSQFGLNFINNSPTDMKKNIVISPLSLQNLMNMILLGSTDNSTSQRELASVLGYDRANLLSLNQSAALASNQRLRPHEAMHSVYESILAATHLSAQPPVGSAPVNTGPDSDLLNTNTGSLKERQEQRGGIEEEQEQEGKHQHQHQQKQKADEGKVKAHLQTSSKSDATPLVGQVKFNLANLILTNEDVIRLKPDYEKDLKTYYNANVEQFSRESKPAGAGGKKAAESGELHERVNSWVKNMTQNQIEKLVEKSDLDGDDLVMVLLNAAHFKGRWLRTFNKKATHERTFYNFGSDKEAKNVLFMKQRGEFAYADFGSGPSGGSSGEFGETGRANKAIDSETLLTEDTAPTSACSVCGNKTDKAPGDKTAPKIELSREEARKLDLTSKLNCSVLALPFSLNDGQELSMILLLPAKRDGVAALQAALDGPTLSEIYKSLSEQQVHVEIPKFSFEGAHDARATLVRMGLSSIFNNAQLDRMFEVTRASRRLEPAHVNKVIHKAKITVDESGAEAAAASVASIHLRTFIRPPVPYFSADHPFLFIIRHNRSNMPLFMGRVSSL